MANQIEFLSHGDDWRRRRGGFTLECAAKASVADFDLDESGGDARLNVIFSSRMNSLNEWTLSGRSTCSLRSFKTSEVALPRSSHRKKCSHPFLIAGNSAVEARSSEESYAQEPTP